MIPCLPLRGFIGLPACHQKSWTDAGLKSMFLQVHEALVYANSKGWAHLDVGPPNIILRFHPGADYFDVMLINWVVPIAQLKSLMRFVGCLPYTHNELLNQPKVIRPCLDHDLASLAYTLACLKVSSIPWVETSQITAK
jgi:serine/threonine protein kinase